MIRIEKTIEEAKYYDLSPIENIDMLYINGIQLLPNNELPYIQTTSHPEGIEIEEPTVYVIDLCGNELADITDSFNIENAFNDSNGLPQVDWSLTNIHFDAGGELVMLKIVNGFNEELFTSYFRLTEIDSDFTSIWNYKNNNSDAMQSVQLCIYKRQSKSDMNITSYNSIVDGNIVNSNTMLSRYEVWASRIVDKNFWEEFKELFLNRIVYCDLQRCSAKDPIETPDLEDVENYFETSFTLVRDKNDTYDPLALPFVPPTPVPPTQILVLSNVQSLNNTQVQYTFNAVNFSPDYIQLQYSADGVTNWISNSGSPISPRINTVPNHKTNGYYYRVYYPPLNIASNVLQIPVPAIVITNITATPSYFNKHGNQYTVSYTVTGYDLLNFLAFEGSLDGIDWRRMNYDENYNNPKIINTPYSQNQFKYFRVKDYTQGITSNIFEIEL